MHSFASIQADAVSDSSLASVPAAGASPWRSPAHGTLLLQRSVSVTTQGFVGNMSPVSNRSSVASLMSASEATATAAANKVAPTSFLEAEELSCRICLDPIDEYQLLKGHAAHLGCRCSSGLSYVHAGCGNAWWGLKGAYPPVCEVCNHEVRDIAIASHVREVAAAAAAAVAESDAAAGVVVWETSPLGILTQRLVNTLRPPTPPFSSVSSYLAAYAAFCLLPGMLASLCVLFFVFKVVGGNAGVTMVAAVALASATIVHWVYNPRPVEHLTFTLVLVSASFVTMLALQLTLPHWSTEAAVAAGCGVGLGAAVALHTGLLIPLLRCSVLRAQRGGARGAPHSPGVASAGTAATVTAEETAQLQQHQQQQTRFELGILML